MRKLLWISIAMLMLGGCAHVFSKDILREVNGQITFAELLRAPEAYRGEMILLGGVIVKTENKREGTLLEVYQTALDRGDRPIKVDVSEGRFLALYHGLLDSAIYSRGRKVTLAGIVQGGQTQKLGEIDYRYPYLLIKEIHLWPEEPPPGYETYPWGFRDPRWLYPWDPWYDPYRRRR